MPTAYAIAYLVLAIALLTLNPFQFQAYDPSESWVWNFFISDVSENILLFLPLGILLRHRLRLSYSLCLASGFLLSLSIESAQLLLDHRTSNLLDLAANAIGSFMGAFIYGVGISNTEFARGESPKENQGNHPSPNLCLAVMLLPLCWVRAMVTEWQPHGVWILLPSAIATLLILQSPHRPAPFNSAQLILFALAVTPMATEKPLLWLPAIAASFLIYGVARRSGLSSKHLSLGALSIGLGLTIHVNGFWIRALPHHLGEGWHNLHWIEILLSLITFVSAVIWLRGGPIQQPKA